MSEKIVEMMLDNSLRHLASGSHHAADIRLRATLEWTGLSGYYAQHLTVSTINVWMSWFPEDYEWIER